MICISLPFWNVSGKIGRLEYVMAKVLGISKSVPAVYMYVYDSVMHSHPKRVRHICARLADGENRKR